MSEDYSAYVGVRWRALVRTAVMLGCSRQDAEDLVQTALIRCYRSWDKVTAASDLDAYVHRVLVNCLATSRKRRWWREEPRVELPESLVPDSTSAVALRVSLSVALGRLSPQHRTVLVLRYVSDLSVQQVAEVLGIPVGTVKSRLSRAIAVASRDMHLEDLHRE